MAATKIATLANLQLYDNLLKEYMSAQDALSLKTVTISGNTLKFYKVTEPVGSTEPAYVIELPEGDLSGYVKKLVNAIEGNVLVATADGSMKDSGTKLTDLAKKTEVTTQIAEAISKAGHMQKEVVTVLPEASAAKENVLYLYKKESATGSDKYEIYTKIGDELVMIDDTSVDLSGYMSTEQVKSAIATAKQEAIDAASADATKKANQALADAKAYTDGEIGKVNTAVETLTGRVTANEKNIATNTTNIKSNTDKITALQGLVGDGFTAITDSEIKALFGK